MEPLTPLSFKTQLKHLSSSDRRAETGWEENKREKQESSSVSHRDLSTYAHVPLFSFTVGRLVGA